MATRLSNDFRDKKVNVIVADTKLDMQHMLGKFVDESFYDTLVEEDTDCYIKPNCDLSEQVNCDLECSKCPGGVNEENVAFIFRKNWFTEEQQLGAYHGLKGAAKDSDNRGMAAGTELSQIETGQRRRVSALQYELLKYMSNPFERIDGGDQIQDIIDKHGKEPELLKEMWILADMDQGFEFDSWLQKTRNLPKEEMTLEASRVFEWVSTTSYANKVKSGVAGYYDRYPRIPFLRETGYNEANREEFKKSLPFLQRLDEGFRKLLPKRWSAQRKAADRLDQRYLIEGTVFTTLTVNSKFQTACHLDAGDLAEGFSNLVVVSNDGNYTGGYLVFPEYRVAVNVRPGDLLLVANHTIIHGNVEFNFGTPESDRVSIVAYFREGMLDGGVKEYEDARKEFVGICAKNQGHKFWRPRWNGIYPGSWSSKEWFDFMKSKKDGDKWIDSYHPELREKFESSGLEEFFG